MFLWAAAANALFFLLLLPRFSVKRQGFDDAAVANVLFLLAAAAQIMCGVLCFPPVNKASLCPYR